MLISAQGELPNLPPLGQAFAVVELRGDAEVLSFDYGTQPPTVSKGSAVLLEDLQLKGLKDESVKEEKGQQFNCPNCGAPVTVALQTSKSITCGSCNSLIDLSQGLGGALKSAMQDEPINPLIPLGTLGQLQGVQWQVVGFQHRMGVAKGDDEHFGWSEYLLYNQKRGFCFLVDSEEGWSLVRPTTGAPRMASSSAQKASYMGTDYQLKYSYSAETNYVCGEFYWLVQRGQTTQNRDFANGRRLLSLEQSGSELVWSSGDQMSSDTVAKAFGLQDKKDLLKRGDVAPFSAAPSMSVGTIIVVVIVLVLLSALFSRCSSCDPSVENCSSSSRSSGGSFGGFSGGGGHK
jgi:ribosomal protein S27AE